MDNTYSFEILSENMVIATSNEHKFGTDAFLLADFASIRKKDICVDIGTGCGIIPFIWCKNKTAKKIIGIDIQKKAIDQLNLSINKCKSEYNNSEPDEKITPILLDIKNIDELKDRISFASFDKVVSNPPYKLVGAGIISESESDKIARHETACTIDDICVAGEKLLKFGGKLSICQRPERLADVITSMKNHNIEPKRLRFVSKCQTRSPYLFLIEGTKGAKSFMQVLPSLFTSSDSINGTGDSINGTESFSAEMLRIYGKI